MTYVPPVQHTKRSPDIPALIETLEQFGIRYVLTGSVAARAYGVDIGQAGDFDITPALDAENLGHLAALLEEIEAGFDPNGTFGHWETEQNGEKTWVIDEATPELRAEQANWRPDPTDVDSFDSLFCTRLGNFDIVPELSGAYETLMKRATQMNVWGHDVWVIHIDELLAALTVPRRRKDESRVRQLRAIQRQRGEQGA